MSSKFVYDVPFNRPFLTGREIEYVRKSIEEGHISGDGDFTVRCQKILEEMIGAKRVFLTTSCSDALEMAALLLEIGPGDEFIVPSFTFVSTANAFVLRGATPAFADIRGDTLNIDETKLEALITPRTRAVVLVHYAGVACELDEILSVAEAHDLKVIEDNAHGLMGSYRGRPLGSFGLLATQSFHETKNLICGEGGALVVNDGALVERAEILRDKGTNRKRFLRGQVDKYTWVDVGSSFLPSDMLAAYLFAQLESRDDIQSRRRDIFVRYESELRDWALERGVRMPFVPSHCRQPYHMFYLVMPSESSRDALLAHLRERAILGVFHYQALHLSEMGRKSGGKPGDCPVAERASTHLVRLPFYTGMTPDEQGRVIDALRAFDP